MSTHHVSIVDILSVLNRFWLRRLARYQQTLCPNILAPDVHDEIRGIELTVLPAFQEKS